MALRKAPPAYTTKTGRHMRKCECYECTMKRLEKYKKRVELMSTPRMPTSVDQMVPVRAHFRRQPNYLNKTPYLRYMVEGIVKGLLKQANPEDKS